MITPTYLYKILSVTDWEESQNDHRLKLSQMDSKFIHLATDQQVPHVIQKFWSSRSCVILKLKRSDLVGDLRYEKNPGGMSKYYHLYHGSIPFSAILEFKRYVKTFS